MRPVYQYLIGTSALPVTPWVSVDYLQTAFNLGLLVDVSSGASLTATVQLTDDDITQDGHYVTATQTTTTITVTDHGPTLQQGNVNAGAYGHGLSVGDWVKLLSTNIQPTAVAAANTMDGEYAVATVVNATQYTLTSAVSQSATAGPFTTASTARVYPHATLAAIAARTASSQQFPVMAVRLLLASWVSGNAALTVLQGMGSRS